MVSWRVIMAAIVDSCKLYKSKSFTLAIFFRNSTRKNSPKKAEDSLQASRGYRRVQVLDKKIGETNLSRKWISMRPHYPHWFSPSGQCGLNGRKL
ncbi:hypothetical protein V6N13_017103 [Hibiscus sabdariffa]|uniref:Uncharacterized protein n=1 Tax=Hibiscus sabdariffa TaxID=183260 RepID=A0ABR2CYB1_9ROSI